jgi:hypothetical protein
MDFVYKTAEEQSAARTWTGNLEKLIKSALAGSGPFILKILQQINTGNDSQVEGGLSVAKLTEDIFSNIPGLTLEESKYVKSKFAIAKTYVEAMNPVALGSASIAEAHLSRSGGADTFGEDIPVLLKFVKPMYAYYFLCEVNFLLTTAWKKLRDFASTKIQEDAESGKISPEDVPERTHILVLQCRKLLMFFIQEFSKEFNYEMEFVNTTIGYQVYNEPRGNLKSIVAITYAVNPFPVLALEAVEGQTVDKVVHSTLGLINDVRTKYATMDALEKEILISEAKQKAQTEGMILDNNGAENAVIKGMINESIKAARDEHRIPSAAELKPLYAVIAHLNDVWYTNTLWGNGFFHADAHPGNAIWDAKRGFLYLIDFGSCGLLNSDQQCQLISAMITSGRLDTKLTPITVMTPHGQRAHERNVDLAKTFIIKIWNLCEVRADAPKNLEELSKLVLKEYAEDITFGTLFLDIVRFSLDIGNCSNNDVLMFGRGAAYVSNMIVDVGSACDDTSMCPVWSVDSVATSNLMRNPQQLARYAITGRVC